MNNQIVDFDKAVGEIACRKWIFRFVCRDIAVVDLGGENIGLWGY